MNKEYIIFDTDIGGDCDDAGALALLHALCENDEAELLAVTACYASPFVAGCIDAINTHYGRSVPVGINYENETKTADDTADYKGYAEPICKEFPNKYKDNGLTPADTLDLLRETLANAKDGSVTFVVTGTLSSMARLIQSGPDKFSNLTGKELVAKKIKRTVVMGGRFKESWPFDINVDAEWNIKGDIRAAQIACNEWIGELVFTSYEIGLWCITLQDFIDNSLGKNPAALAYKLFPWSDKGRESWDLTAILHAVRPNAEYWNLHPWGRIHVDDNGVTTFETRPDCRHTYLLPRQDYDMVKNTIDSVVKSSKYY